MCDPLRDQALAEERMQKEEVSSLVIVHIISINNSINQLVIVLLYSAAWSLGAYSSLHQLFFSIIYCFFLFYALNSIHYSTFVALVSHSSFSQHFGFPVYLHLAFASPVRC